MTKNSWQQLSCNVEAAQVDQLSEVFLALGALAITCDAASTEKIFQENLGDEVFWIDTAIHALFSNDAVTDVIISAVQQSDQRFKGLVIDVETIEEQDWVRLTQAQFTPQCIAETLWICPREQEATITDDLPIVRLDPGLAFGTGTHPTTRLCLQALCQIDLRDKAVLDYGCGSGILSLAALGLGAKTVCAVDHDPQALEATRNNARLNNIDANNELQILLPEDLGKKTFPVIVANILAKPLLNLSAQLIASLAPGGTLLLSGLLREDVSAIRKIYSLGLKEQKIHYDDEWVLMRYDL